MKELASAMAKAQQAMKPAMKDSTNPHFKSKYADLTSVWEACRDALTKNGLSVIQSTDFDGESVWIKTILMHQSGEFIEGRYPLRPQQQTPQGYGSAISYARRYALAAMVGVVADDDDGNAASAPSDKTPAKPKEDIDARTKKFVNESLEAIAECRTAKALDDWYAISAGGIAWVKANRPDEYKYLESALNQARAKLQAAA